jgi:hypothetical protein
MKRKKKQGVPRSPGAQDRRADLKKLEDELLKSVQGSLRCPCCPGKEPPLPPDASQSSRGPPSTRRCLRRLRFRRRARDRRERQAAKTP